MRIKSYKQIFWLQVYKTQTVLTTASLRRVQVRLVTVSVAAAIRFKL